VLAGLLLLAGAARAASAPVMTDAAAAAAVSPQTPSYEPHPENFYANHNIPTATQLSAFHAAPLNFLGGPPASDFASVTGDYTGSTDQIIQWAVNKWGYGSIVNYFRAEAMQESTWNQGQFGDYSTTQANCSAGTWNGWVAADSYCWDSYGIFQAKVLSYNGWPMVRTSTAFNADLRLAYFAACMAGDVAYYAQETPTAGYPTYPNGTTAQMEDGCMGSWYSGNWYDSGALSYIASVKAQEAASTWLYGLQITAPVANTTISGNAVPVTISATTDPAVCYYYCLDFNGMRQSCNGTGTWTLDTTAANGLPVNQAGGGGGVNGASTLRASAWNCNSNAGPFYETGEAVNVSN